VLSPKSINVSWQPILFSEVTGYMLSYTSAARYARGDNVTVSGATVSHMVIEKLEENTVYNITVHGVTNNSISDASDAVSVLTWTDGKRINFVDVVCYITEPTMCMFQE